MALNSAQVCLHESLSDDLGVLLGHSGCLEEGNHEFLSSGVLYGDFGFLLCHFEDHGCPDAETVESSLMGKVPL